MTDQPGLVVLFGSGETSASGRRIWNWLFEQMQQEIQVAVLETPAGFEPNSDFVAGKVAEFIEHRLQNFRPRVNIVPARKRDTSFSPDNPDILSPMLTASVIFMGPGSPTYTVRQLEASLAWEILKARHNMGSAIVLASASAVAAGAYALPVYEIYKVGEDLFWFNGLDLFARYGLAPTFVPHWNNAEGGVHLDTSRCYVGIDRFLGLKALLPSESTVVGIDEHTALIVNIAEQSCQVLGLGDVTIITGDEISRIESGSSFDLQRLGACQMPAREVEIHPVALSLIEAAQFNDENRSNLASEVLILVEERQVARANKNWAEADALRDKLLSLGWQVRDSPAGPKLEPVADQ